MSSDLGTLLAGLGAMVAFPVVFVGWWAVICWTLGLLGGWRGLAARYATDLPPPPGGPGWSSGALGWVNYRNTLVPAAAEDGLDLRTPRLFAVGHPPLRIPWADVRVLGRRRGLMGERVRLALGPEGTVLTLRGATWDRLGAATARARAGSTPTGGG